MALLGSSATSTSSSGLSATYLNSLIEQAIDAQRQPVYKLNSQKDQLDIKKAIYSDVKSKLSALKGLIENLTSDHSDTVFDNVKAASSDTDILTATATSSAVFGKYTISVTSLAESHIVRSDRQDSISDELGLSGTFQMNGASIEIEATDSLMDVMEAINNAEYEDGKEVTATIVDNHLVIEAGSTGTSNEITASDTTGTALSSLGILDNGSFKTTLQAAGNAAFTVNGIEITRESNTDLDDVISGVTLNLVDAGTNVELDVSINYTDICMKVSAFVNNLNSTLSYLKAKTQTVVDQENETYTRGALAGETIFSRLRSDLMGSLRTYISGISEDDPQYLADTGITIGSKLKISLDESALTSAMQSNFDGFVQLFDGVMDHYLSVLEPFTNGNSSSNVIDSYINSVDTKIENIDNRIERIERSLEIKENLLIKQYSALYMQNVQFSEQQYGMLGIYSGFNISG